MQILIPVSTRSTFFPEKDFYFPKPLIEIKGTPMINHVIDNLSANISDPEYTFVVNKDDSQKFSIENALKIYLGEDTTVIEKLNETCGALCSSLLAIDHIDHDQPLIISNSDQVLDDDISEKIKIFKENKYDAAVITFESNHPRWSYVMDDDDLVVQAFEKKVISKHAIAGFYYFRKASNFFDSAKRAILNDSSLDGLFYISSTINEMILDNRTVGHSKIQKDKYYSFYAPAPIKNYEENFK